jgi:hypothetical protein
MGRKNRTVRLELTLSESEYGQFKERMELAGIKTTANFLRVMALKGYIINLDVKAVMEPVKLMRNIAGNVNQIAVRVNSTGNIYAEDIAELKEKCEQLSGSVSEIVGAMNRLEE